MACHAAEYILMEKISLSRNFGCIEDEDGGVVDTVVADELKETFHSARHVKRLLIALDALPDLRANVLRCVRCGRVLAPFSGFAISSNIEAVRGI